ncbi:MAG: circadian clock KaiB family protein [Cyanobacteria bacterium SZAS LIN-5]|nr:circadian clock KaiB family protein [Cyanobacteria bacterium SZAS LIN-5]
MSQHHFKLYVMGCSSRSSQAIDNLKRFCEEFMPSEYQLTIIDVLEDPKAAELDKILATPTLIKHQPPPVKRLVGDLTDQEQVSRMLDIAKTRVKQ